MIRKIFVAGIPVPKGNHKGFPYKDKKTGKTRVALTDASGKELVAWQKAIALEFKPYFPVPKAGPIRIQSIQFILPRPKCHWTKSGKPTSKWIPYPIVKPDIDKLLRAFHDALTGIVYIDDRQVIQETPSKRYTDWQEEPGLEVIIDDEFSNDYDGTPSQPHCR